jgi:hypothetical protein
LILLSALIIGLLVGLLRARLENQPWQLPELRHIWLVLVSFVPQFIVFYLPAAHISLSDSVVRACLVGSQVGLVTFCLLNRQFLGIRVLAVGLLLNLVVIVANGGFMPLSTETAVQLIPESILRGIQIGSRVSVGSKDILLAPGGIVFPWLADRFLPPAWFPYRFAFSLGDVFIGMGAFLLLCLQPNRQKGSTRHVSRTDDQSPDQDDPGRAPGPDGSEPPARGRADQQAVL